MARETQSPGSWFRFVAGARTAALATVGPDGRVHSVPICFVLLEPAGDGSRILYSPLDEKPKRVADPRQLRRVRNLSARPRASILVSHWDEDWSRLAFVDLEVTGALLEPGPGEHEAAVAALRRKYPQYETHDLESRPMLRFEIAGVVRWAGSEPDRAAT